jgi:hypothetical protein
LLRFLRPQGHVDALAGGRVGGWAFGRSPVHVEAWFNGTRVARCQPSIRRDDVANAFPGSAFALASGFAFDLPRDMVEGDTIGELRIVAKSAGALQPSRTLAVRPMAGTKAIQRISNAPDSGIVGPYPRQIIDAIASIWPEACADLASVEGQRRFADRLVDAMRTAELNALPVFANYARYLTATLAHCRFVEKHFPATNTRAGAEAADFHCKPNSVRELFTIIHQLYVLKSWGVAGDFAEFGCFKGYSSAMLSFACRELGVRMHIFDSFEGLPPAEGSGYLAGQYAGSLDEVRDHITRFGAIDVVDFHKGFFADTFRNWQPPQMLCLWMDVDLELSARDLMTVADRLDPRASLFSHECTANIFRDGEIVTEPQADNPIPPMLARHEELGRPLTGRYVAGFTGAFWPREGAIPVIDNNVLMGLARALAPLS